MTPEQRDDLREKAGKATKGNWHRRHDDEVWTEGEQLSEHFVVGGGAHDPDAAYIVAAQPQVVIGLLDRIAELEKALADTANALDFAGFPRAADARRTTLTRSKS